MTESTTSTQFPYTAVNLSTPSFVLASNQDFVDPNAQAGTSSNPIVIQEAAVDGWQLMSISCIDPTTLVPSNATVDLTNHKVSVIADPTQQVDCTFTSQPLSPTAAGVSIAGQILSSEGRGIRGLTVKLTDLQNGTTYFAVSNSFGFYEFDDVRVNHTYVIAVISTKRLNIVSNFRTVTPLDDVIGINFTVQPY
jgi:hypothetical protein